MCMISEVFFFFFFFFLSSNGLYFRLEVKPVLYEAGIDKKNPFLVNETNHYLCVHV
ncbi:hypothetical protein HanIR_Chr09g0444191 [Helianthus annuus]|nr:hypothetical protein HanIR_Chr09g0444191 [Helianthus annuus]